MLATGGTTLTASHATGAYIGESGWGLPFGTPGTQFQASGGGFSDRFARPGYQRGVAGDRRRPRSAGRLRQRLTTHRNDTGHQRRRHPLHHPQRQRHQRQRTPLGRSGRPGRSIRRRHLKLINPAIYRIARSAAYHQAFHDITEGSNTPVFRRTSIKGYTAAAGWDPVTGWGSPNAQALIPLLARYANQ